MSLSKKLISLCLFHLEIRFVLPTTAIVLQTNKQHLNLNDILNYFKPKENKISEV